MNGGSKYDYSQRENFRDRLPHRVARRIAPSDAFPYEYLMDQTITYISKFDKPHRLKHFDYSSVCSYMLTFNTLYRKPLLSDVVQNSIYEPPTVILKPFGVITEKAIQQIGSHYEGVTVDNYVIMPDHVHLLITIDQYVPAKRTDKPRVSVMIQQLKSVITKQCGEKIWQADFYDVIADTEFLFRRCDDYIDNNPAVWLEKNGIEPPAPK